MRFSLPVLPALLVLAYVLGASSPAHAYCRSTTAKPTKAELAANECVTRGLPLYWRERELHFALNPAFASADFDEASVRALLADAFAPWQALACDGESPGFELVVDDEPSAEKVPAHVRNQPNDNVVLFETAERWRKLENDPLAFALTSVWYEPETGELLGADLEINEGRGPYAICPDDGCESLEPYPGEPTLLYADLPNVVTHETGHILGLAHSDEPDSTMYFSALPEDTNKRSLESDDLAGFCASYGPDADVGPPTRRDEGCSVRHAATTQVHGPYLWLLALGALLARRRRL